MNEPGEEQIPIRLSTELGHLFHTVIETAQCPFCLKVLCDPFKSSCGHSACADCWRQSNTICVICGVSAEEDLHPNKILKVLVAAILDLSKLVLKMTGVDVLKNVMDDKNSPNEEEEPFYEIDKKYRNLKTYEKQSLDINCSTSDMEKRKQKVHRWLNMLDRNNVIPDNSLLNVTNVDKEISLESDAEKDETKMLLKLRNLNVSDKPATDKDNISTENKMEKENSWRGVKKAKKMFKKVGKTSKKKLNVSVEISTKSNSPNIDLNNSDKSLHMVEVVNTPPLSSNPEYKNINDSLMDVMFLSKDALALEEVRTRSKDEPIVKFFYRGTLANKPCGILCKRIPFYYKTSCLPSTSRSTSEQVGRVTSKRSIETNKNDDIEMNGKRNKLEPSINVNNDMVIHFESQSQTETEPSDKKASECVSNKNKIKENLIVSESVNKLPNKISEADEKLIALKKDVKFYTGDDLNSTTKSDNLKNKSSTPSDENGSPKGAGTSDKKTANEINRGDSPIIIDLIEDVEKIPNSQISNASVVEDTPQKNNSSKIGKNILRKSSKASKPKRFKGSCEERTNSDKSLNSSDMDITSVCNSTVSNPNKNEKSKSETKIKPKIKNTETPVSISNFNKDVTYQSTPLQPRAKRALYEINKNVSKIIENPEISTDGEQSVTLIDNSGDNTHSKTLRENEFIKQVFDNSCENGRKSVVLSTSKNSLSNKSNAPTSSNDSDKNKKKLEKSSLASSEKLNNPSSTKTQPKKICLACSCLSIEQKRHVINLTTLMNWDFKEKFSTDITHLVVKVDQDNTSSRSVKYVQAVAAGCWVVSFEWAIQCLKSKSHVKEDEFEALDTTGEKGPYISRTSQVKLFDKMTFYLLPPMKTLPIQQAAEILELAGGKVVKSLNEIIIKDRKKISVLIADEDNSEESRFMDLCILHRLVPVNIAWVLESIGTGNCFTMGNWILVNHTFLPDVDWPEELLLMECEEDSE